MNAWTSTSVTISVEHWMSVSPESVDTSAEWHFIDG